MSAIGNAAMTLRKINSAINSLESFCAIHEAGKSVLISEAYRDLIAARIHLTHSMQDDAHADTERPAPQLRVVK